MKFCAVHPANLNTFHCQTLPQHGCSGWAPCWDIGGANLSSWALSWMDLSGVGLGVVLLASWGGGEQGPRLFHCLFQTPGFYGVFFVQCAAMTLWARSDSPENLPVLCGIYVCFSLCVCVHAWMCIFCVLVWPYECVPVCVFAPVCACVYLCVCVHL